MPVATSQTCELVGNDIRSPTFLAAAEDLENVLKLRYIFALAHIAVVKMLDRHILPGVSKRTTTTRSMSTERLDYRGVP
jgi:hypothetical protein